MDVYKAVYMRFNSDTINYEDLIRRIKRFNYIHRKLVESRALLKSVPKKKFFAAVRSFTGIESDSRENMTLREIWEDITRQI